MNNKNTDGEQAIKTNHINDFKIIIDQINKSEESHHEQMKDKKLEQFISQHFKKPADKNVDWKTNGIR